jgi:hypothetical protein
MSNNSHDPLANAIPAAIAWSGVSCWSTEGYHNGDNRHTTGERIEYTTHFALLFAGLGRRSWEGALSVRRD